MTIRNRHKVLSTLLILCATLFSLLSWSCKEKSIQSSVENVNAPLYFTAFEESVLQTTGRTLTKDLPVQKISISDNEYHKIKNYLAFDFNDVMKFVFEDHLEGQPSISFVFTATDGYKAVVDKERFNESKAYLAIKDLDDENWEAQSIHPRAQCQPTYIHAATP